MFSLAELGSLRCDDKTCNPYGDRHACARITDILEDKEYRSRIGEK